MEFITNFLYALLIVLMIAMLINAYMWFKNDNTLKQCLKINDAIYEYNKSVDWDPDKWIDVSVVMKTYEEVLYRFWDWGYEHIVDDETLEKIRPFIMESKNE